MKEKEKEILTNQLIIMQGIQQLLWDSNTGSYKCDYEYLRKLKLQIHETGLTLEKLNP